MTELESFWFGKTDSELQDAAAHLQDFTSKAQFVIRKELRRRELNRHGVENLAESREALSLESVLKRLGIKKRVAVRGCLEEAITLNRVSSSAFKQQLKRVIQVAGGPIRWIAVSRYADQDSSWYSYEFGVPDSKINPAFPRVEIRLKTNVSLGWVVEVYWKGRDFGLGVLDGLNQDDSISTGIKHSHQSEIDRRWNNFFPNTEHLLEFEIDADPVYCCWVLTGRYSPGSELWDCHQTIARHLLSAPGGPERPRITFCPQCKAQYRPGFKQCSDCGVETVDPIAYWASTKF